MIIYGQQEGSKHTEFFITQLISTVITSVFMTTFLGLASGDMALFFFGLFLCFLIPYILIIGLDKQINEKHYDIHMQLPELIDKMTLFINAGETVQKALIQSVDLKVTSNSFFQQELQKTIKRLEQQISLPQALEELSQRCGLQEVSVFTTTILLNYKRGGHELVDALRDLSKRLWEKRKIATKTKGEQASSKLVFPMVIIFIIVMVIIATPAMMMF
ncbi:type II secretion system F family protein [Caldalkalibacillus salinus]|uniref:type II secretion system F family protein n=1 Tax=Caldalkalibacillus salinus TaxID=2803787 RepID=UPI0019246DF5|nr:type II secretion system F family protein [Caldalkalibacillus salinus]